MSQPTDSVAARLTVTILHLLWLYRKVIPVHISCVGVMEACS